MTILQIVLLNNEEKGMNINMHDDIKRTMNIFCIFFVIYIFTLPFASNMVQYFDNSRNIFLLIPSIWMSLVVSVPTSYILKISPIKNNVVYKSKVSIFEIIIMILFSLALYRIIVFSYVQVPFLEKIITASDNTLFILEDTSFFIKFLLVLFASVLEELLFRGILLNKLRVYGDIFAVIVSSVVFSLIHYKTFIVVIFGGLLIGMIYIISNDIKAAIILHFIVNFSTFFVEEYFTYNEIFILYIILIVVCIVIMLLDKRFRKNSIILRNKYKEESSFNKGKYSTAFKSEGLLFIGMITLMSIVSEIVY